MCRLLVIVAVILLTACGNTRYIPVETVRTEYRDKDNSELFQVVKSLTEQLAHKERQVDSLMQSNRELLILSEKGDTIRYDRETVVYRSSHREAELEKLVEAKNDSIRDLKSMLESIKCDSVAIPYPVERELSRWEQTKMDFGGMAIGALVIAICCAVVWLIKRFKR